MGESKGTKSTCTDPESERQSNRAFQVLFVMAAALIVPTGFTLSRVFHPAVLQSQSDNPTPLGYTYSLLLFIIPILVLGVWFALQSKLGVPWGAFWRTMIILIPLGFGLDLAFGNSFFSFPNKLATLGYTVPARGGPIPIEEFVFYSTGFILILLSYVWADEYWLRLYNLPDYGEAVKDLRPIARFHWPSLALGLGLIALAAIYKKNFAESSAGFPSYFSYLVAVALVPSAGFFRTVNPFMNWRAFGFTFFLILLISLLWEVTLALPYGWWAFNDPSLIGIRIKTWANLPIEEVFLWMAVSYTTVIVYEVIKICLVLRTHGKSAKEALFGK